MSKKKRELMKHVQHAEVKYGLYEEVLLVKLKHVKENFLV